MLSQIKTLRESLPKTPIVNPLDLYSVYDDFSNGDLSLGSYAGTDLLGNTRLKKEAVPAFSIVDSVLNVSNVTTVTSAFNLSYNITLSFPCLINVVFNIDSGEGIYLGLTNNIGSHYLPREALFILSTSDTYYTRKNLVDTNTTDSFPNFGTKTSWVIACTSGSMTAYEKTDSIYSELYTWTTTAYTDNTFYASVAFRSNTSDTVNRIAVAETAYQSVGQLEALFPLI